MIKSVKLGEIARVSSGGTPSRANPSYWNGNIPWVKTTQIQNCVITPQDVDEWITEEGLKNSSAKMVPAGTIVLGMIGQGKTRGQVGYLSFDACTNQNAATITCNNECDSWFIYQYLLFNYENIRALSNSSGQGNLNLGLVEIIPITLPPLLQQKKIANLLGTWDNAIEKIEALIAAKEKQFEWLMEKLFRPNDTWTSYRLGELFDNRKETHNTDLPLVSITRERGVIPHSETNRKDNSSEDKSKYLRIRPNDIGYNTVRMWQGVSALSGIDGIVSPAYTICIPMKVVDPEFMAFLFKTKPMIHKFYRYSQGLTSDTWNLKFHNFCEVKAEIPDIETQVEIAQILNTAKHEIDLIKKTLEQYRSQKRGLMQKLITGEWQVGSSQHISEETYQELSKENVA